MPKGPVKEPLRTTAGGLVESSRDARDISNILSVLDAKNVKTTPFGANVTGENSYRRAERASAALHLVTNHIPESEPLRASVRDASLRLLNRIMELRSGFRAMASEKGQSALAEIRQLISLVRLLAIAGYVSAQNTNALVEALDELGNLILISERSTLAEQVTLSRADLTPPAHSVTTPNLFSSRNIGQKSAGGNTVKNIKNISTSQENTERPAQIMDMLRAGGVLGIRDIAVNLPQYSEKMIQRELAELVRLNKVEKTGEKRWSRYKALS